MTEAMYSSPSGYPRFTSASRVLRILGIDKCPECKAPVAYDFAFHPDIDDFITCPMCRENIDITGRWMVKTYKFLELVRQASSEFNSTYIKRILKQLVLCSSNEYTIPLLTEEIEKIENPHLQDAWKATLRELLPGKDREKDDALHGDLSLGDLWDMKEGAKENGDAP